MDSKIVRLFCIACLVLFMKSACADPATNPPNELIMPNAPLNEEVLSIEGDPERPVMLQVTLLKPNGPGPFPLVVLNHGANGSEAPPAQQPRNRATFAADYFLSRGYAVVLPMMRGYAGSGGKAEIIHCNIQNLGINNAKDIDAVISYFQAQPYIDPGHIVVAGQSFGGWNTLVFGTLHRADVKGLINFSGGLIAGHCPSEWEMEHTAGDLGAHTYTPSIWFYGDNDKLFSTETWRTMYKNYVEKGGKAELVSIGKFMDNSHLMLSYPESFDIWVPKVDAFLTRIGMPGQLLYPEYMPTKCPQPSHFASIEDVDAVPYLNEKGKELYKRFLEKKLPRAIAISSNGNVSAQSGGFDALKRAIDTCQGNGKTKCKLYAVDNDVVWTKPTASPAPTEFALLEDEKSIPYLGDKGRQGYLKWLTYKKPRAFVISPNGAWNASAGGIDPIEQAMTSCANSNAKNQCKLYAVDDAVVWAN